MCSLPVMPCGTVHSQSAHPSQPPFCKAAWEQRVSWIDGELNVFLPRLTFQRLSFLAGTQRTLSWRVQGNSQTAWKGRAVCGIECAINLQLRFLGHLSAGRYLHCSNLSAYYVTHWPTSPPYAVGDFPLGPMYSMGYQWMQVQLTGFLS